MSVQAASRGLASHVLQVGVGLILGFFCVFLGSVMCWFGITGAVTLEATGGTGRFNLQSVHVGVILLVGVVVLVSMALNKGSGMQAVSDSDVVRRPTSRGESIAIES